MSLITYTTAFTGGPSFFTGISGASDLVPHIFPVSIDGRAYMLDTASGRYARTFEARLRDSVDQAEIPGETSINPQGLWRRGQKSWHFGFNQKYGDLPDSNSQRFNDSLGVDVWTEGELTLLDDTKVSLSTTGTNLYLAVVGDELFCSDGTNVKYTTDAFASSPTWTSVAVGGTVRGLVSQGEDAYVTVSGTGLRNIDGSTKVVTNVANGVEFGALGYAKGRLCVGANASSKLWFDPSGNNPTADFTHPDGNFRWTGFASGLNAIYCAGSSGQKSMVYKVTLKADGTLDTPVAAAELPIGEQIKSLSSYLGFILIGTNEGFRYATPDADASLVVGQTISTPSGVLSAEGHQEYVWVGFTNYTSAKTGIGRVDLSHFVDINVPASAPDLMYTGQGDVQSVTTVDLKQVFTVSGVGVVVQDTANLVSEGFCETGTWRWRIPDPKFLAFFDLEYETLNGEIAVDYAYDGGSYSSLGSATTQASISRTMTGPDTQFREANFKVTLKRDSSTTTEGPVLGRWQARAVPSPSRSELFQVPVMLHQRINRFNREYHVDVNFELEKLRDLIHSPRIINYQEGNEVYRCIVESVEWTPVDQPNDDFIFDGTATVTLRSLVE